MPSAEPMARAAAQPISFELPPEREAKEPAEVRGAGRDDVRLLVAGVSGQLIHARFSQLPNFLSQGDLIVLNQSATIPAALMAQRDGSEPVKLHVSTRLPSDLFVVEPVGAGIARRELMRLPGEALAEILTPYRDSRRLWIARLYLPAPLVPYLMRYGEPITYRHIASRWPLDVYQNVFATEPGSAEMPSAGRPFIREMFAQLRDRGIAIAFITLHAGVSTQERDERPHEEAYSVPSDTADAVRSARHRGGRIIAVGTTVVRALESALDTQGRVVASQGWTDVVITPERGVSTVDGILTGFHEPRSSHLAMLEAIAGRDSMNNAYRAALDHGYLWHEFGDSHLCMRTAINRVTERAA